MPCCCIIPLRMPCGARMPGWTRLTGMLGRIPRRDIVPAIMGMPPIPALDCMAGWPIIIFSVILFCIMVSMPFMAGWWWWGALNPPGAGARGGAAPRTPPSRSRGIGGRLGPPPTRSRGGGGPPLTCGFTSRGAPCIPGDWTAGVRFFGTRVILTMAGMFSSSSLVVGLSSSSSMMSSSSRSPMSSS